LLPELEALQYKEATPCATLSPEGLLLPELETLQYKEATPCATLSPEALLLPELEALQYKEATPLKKSVSQLTDQVLLATENTVSVVAQAPLPLLSPPTENPVVIARATTKIENLTAGAKASWPVLWLTQNPYLHNQQLSYKALTDSHSNKTFLCTQFFSQPHHKPPWKSSTCQFTRMHLQQLSQGRKPSQNLNPEKLRSTKKPPSLSASTKEKPPSLSASTIDTLFSFQRKLPITFPRELPVPSPRELEPPPMELPIAFPREPPLIPELPATSPELPREPPLLQLPFPREPPLAPELPIAFQREPPLMPELPATSPGKLPAQHWSIPSSLEEPPVPTRKSL
jgi:hypothetical protein